MTLLAQIDKHPSRTILKGTYKLDMTDYKVLPPKALLGLLKTKKEITIHLP